ncbi:MAG TPA: hypothetical protein VFB72_16480 [Verrucomicrobiae bacterium]|nr:hypothetical protein [Verrucomicrobiae bacterium]
MQKETLITAGLAALTFAAFAGWFLMARRPRQWGEWVEHENDFWHGKGFISVALAEKLKRWEKGRTLRLLAAVTTCIGLIGFALSLMNWIQMMKLQHQKPRMPYNPALHWKPRQTAPTQPKPK